MGGIIVKLARGTARLAFWRKPVEASLDTAAPAVASASIAPAAADVPKPSWFARLKQKLRRGEAPIVSAPAAAPVLAGVSTPAAAVATPAAPPVVAPPPLVPQALEEMLELSDPVASAAPADMLFGDDIPEELVQALASSEVAQAPPVVADSLAAEMDAPETAQAQDPLAEVPQLEAAAVTAPPSAEAAAAEGDESHKPKLVSRLLGILSKKRVWIPSVSVAMLAVMGTLSFMLMQSKQATHELQAELANAKKQLKQAPVKPRVIPPLLVAHQDVAPHGVDPAAASLQAVSHEEASQQAGAGSSSSQNADIDCDISDKVSVGKNLRNCIEAFNQATAR
ncbi:MAG: hypothetical protein ACYCZT_11380 [Thiobacillus sp.]